MLKVNSKILPWIYLASVFGSQIVALGLVIGLVWTFPELTLFLETPYGAFSASCLSGIAALLVVLAFIRPHSIASVAISLGFNGFSLKSAFVAIACGMLLGVVGVTIVWLKILTFTENVGFIGPAINRSGVERYLFVLALLVGPFLEEIIMRGFLYQGFRKEYDIRWSVCVSVLIAAFTHWSVVVLSPWSFLIVAVLQVSSCALMEKTQNLWNSILCHVAYNATLVCGWLSR